MTAPGDGTALVDGPQNAPPAVIAAGGVFLPGSVCDPVWRILRAELTRHRADGGKVRPEILAALDALRAAALAHVSANGLPERTSPDLDASSTVKPLLTTGDLATLLRCTERHARRLAAAAHIEPAARGLWHREDVAALAAARRTDHH